ncbi:MAG: ADP-ribosylglycohydrolase family protein [Bacteroidota bacterium]
MADPETLNDRARGAMYGVALGDALGAPTEFMRVEEILRRWPPNGPECPTGTPARVTDDTQMAIAVAEALLDAAPAGRFSAETLEPPLRARFVEWLDSPDNNRAPGMTCLHACELLLQGYPWLKATVPGSKGCGANMRVPPVGILPSGPHGIDDETRAAIAQFQAALTHGHPTGLAASDLTARAITDLINGADPATLPDRLIDYARAQREIYHTTWLGTLWQRPGMKTPAEFISRGWDECLGVLGRLKSALAMPDHNADPCIATGDGWIAEEALSTGLHAFLLFPDDPVQALRRAAVTRGDSDSIASLCGAFAGARHGMAAWPEEWVTRIEYGKRIGELADALSAAIDG